MGRPPPTAATTSGGLAAGTYRVGFPTRSGAYVAEWHENAPGPWEGDAVVVTAGRHDADRCRPRARGASSRATSATVRRPDRGHSGNALLPRVGGGGGEPARRLRRHRDGRRRLLPLPGAGRRGPTSCNSSTTASPRRRGPPRSTTTPSSWAPGPTSRRPPGEPLVVDPVLDVGGGLTGLLLDDESFTPLSFAFPMECTVWAWVADAGLPGGGEWRRYAEYGTGEDTGGVMHGSALAPGVYKMSFGTWTESYLREWWHDQPDVELRDTIPDRCRRDARPGHHPAHQVGHDLRPCHRQRRTAARQCPRAGLDESVDVGWQEISELRELV